MYPESVNRVPRVSIPARNIHPKPRFVKDKVMKDGASPRLSLSDTSANIRDMLSERAGYESTVSDESREVLELLLLHGAISVPIH
jgi:hypothetical protein